MKELTEKQIDRIIDSAEVEMETNGELTWTTSKLIIRALKQKEEQREPLPDIDTWMVEQGYRICD